MSKKVRCTCCRCGANHFLPAAGTDTTIKFLCPPCDSRFVIWGEGTGKNVPADELLETFLKERPVSW